MKKINVYRLLHKRISRKKIGKEKDMRITKRAAAISPSLTLEITAKAKKLKQQGVSVVSFGAGEPDFNTPAPIMEAAKHAMDAGYTKYTPASGSEELKKAVCDKLLKENGKGACLIKPQFEAGREKVGKKGVVRDISVHKEVIENVIAFTKEMGFSVKGLDFSPIKGPEGNIEYLMFVEKTSEKSVEFDVDKIVELSHTLNL